MRKPLLLEVKRKLFIPIDLNPIEYSVHCFNASYHVWMDDGDFSLYFLCDICSAVETIDAKVRNDSSSLKMVFVMHEKQIVRAKKYVKSV